MTRSRFNQATLLVGFLAALAVGIGLVSTNPGRSQFEEFAGEQLSEAITRDICLQGHLSTLLRLVLPNCVLLVRQQQTVLGQLAWAQTRRLNFGIFSLFLTELGGQELLPNVRLPTYRATSFGAAGRVVLLTSSTSQAATASP